MDGAELQAVVRLKAEGLPAVVWEQPFGPEWEVYKVRGKVFALLTALRASPVVILKSDPGEAVALREAYPEITPGYHMNKRHWITLAPGGALEEELVEDLVDESYRLVVAKLPRRQRPVDTATFGVRAPGAKAGG
jgi:predicted DNA-binding protein (MmcQ/YjbR family)